jgi:hypothetical protein
VLGFLASEEENKNDFWQYNMCNLEGRWLSNNNQTKQKYFEHESLPFEKLLLFL